MKQKQEQQQKEPPKAEKEDKKTSKRKKLTKKRLESLEDEEVLVALSQDLPAISPLAEIDALRQQCIQLEHQNKSYAQKLTVIHQMMQELFPNLIQPSRNQEDPYFHEITEAILDLHRLLKNKEPTSSSNETPETSK
jgi:hypothetical protein